MNPFIKELFEYNHHCNQRLIIVFRENESRLSEKAIKLLGHVLNAHEIWNSRINSSISSVGVWEKIEIQEMEKIDMKNYSETIHILDYKDLSEQILYKNSRDQKFSNSIRDVLFHIINHSTYHRGQIASELKHCGIEPLNTDYIFYKRDNLSNE